MHQIPPCPVSNLDDAGPTSAMGGVRGGVAGWHCWWLIPPLQPTPPLPPTRHHHHLTMTLVFAVTYFLPQLLLITCQLKCKRISISVFRFQIWNKQQNLLLLPGLLRSSLAEAHHPYDCCNVRLHINLKRKFFIPVKCRISSSWRLFRSLNFKFPILWALKPCDPRNSYGTVRYPGNSMIARE